MLKEHVEAHVSEGLELQKARKSQPNEAPDSSAEINDGMKDNTEVQLPSSHEQTKQIERITCEEDMAWSSGSPPIPLKVHLEGEAFLAVIHEAYTDDTLFSKVLLHLEQHPHYSVKSGIIYTTNAVGNMVVAILGALSKGRRITEIAIDQAHRIIGHKAARKTRDYLSCWFWWPTLAKDIESFCKSCGVCQTTKTSTEKPKGLLHSLPILDTPWQSIAMDFMGPFPKCMGFFFFFVNPIFLC